MEPASVALHAVRQCKLMTGDKAAVFGAVPIGLLVIETLRAAGASEIYAVERFQQNNATKVLELEATIVNNPKDEDADARLHELTNGGVDVAFEVTGVPAVIQQAIDSTLFKGESIVSIWETAASILPNNIVFSECTVKGIFLP